MTIDEMVERAKVAVEQECGPDFWQMLSHNKTHDHESCYLCGCDIEFMGGVDHHEDWCPTVIARRVLDLPTNREPE